MKNTIQSMIDSLLEPLAKEAKDTFERDEISALAVIVRITVTTYRYIESEKTFLQRVIYNNCGGNDKGIDSKNNGLQYSIETILSGLDSFQKLNSAYKILVDASETTLTFKDLSGPSFLDKYGEIFNQMSNEHVFEKKCRFLLDLYHMQIVFSGLLYR